MLNAADNLSSMARLFGEATRLNLEATTALVQGRPVNDLAPLFQAKETISTQLTALLPLLKVVQGSTTAEEELLRVQAAQGEAARSEARLSELLGKLVSQRGTNAWAYQQNSLPTPAKRWETEG